VESVPGARSGLLLDTGAGSFLPLEKPRGSHVKADEGATRLWEAYWSYRENSQHLEALVKHYWAVLERCVGEYGAAHPDRVNDQADILSEAAETLAKMIPKYEPREGVSVLSWVKATARAAARFAGLRFARQAGCRGALNGDGERAKVLSLDSLLDTADSEDRSDAEARAFAGVSPETFLHENPERIATERESQQAVDALCSDLAAELDRLNLPGEAIVSAALRGVAWPAIEASTELPGIQRLVQDIFARLNVKHGSPIDVPEPRPIRTLADALAANGVDGKLYNELRADGRSQAEIAETFFGLSEDRLRRIQHRAEALLCNTKQQGEPRPIAA